MNTLIKARQVADYVTLNWQLPSGYGESPAPVSENLGAILVDAVFQSGLNYKTVVFPRVRAVAQAFPGLTTLSAMARAIRTKSFSAALSWKHAEKPRRLRQLIEFLRAKGLETVSNLRLWLSSSVNRRSLRTVRGIGHKTIDYFSRLLGLPSIAVDRHAHRLLREAGVAVKKYEEARRILEFAADLLRVSRWTFDRLMWETVSAMR